MPRKLFLAIIPKSSKNRLIFPLHRSKETCSYGYSLGRFTPAFLDFLVTKEDVKQVLDECSYAAEEFKISERVQNMISLSVFIYSIFLVTIFIVFLTNSLPVILSEILLYIAPSGFFILIL